MNESKEPRKDPDLDLEFPDWSGMDDSTNRISPEAALRLNEEYQPWFRELAKQGRISRPPKCLVEFVL